MATNKIEKKTVFDANKEGKYKDIGVWKII